MKDKKFDYPEVDYFDSQKKNFELENVYFINKYDYLEEISLRINLNGRLFGK